MATFLYFKLMKFICYTCLYFFSFYHLQAQYVRIKDSVSGEPIPFGTVSFGNGNGLFADDEGVFYYTEKLYPDVDSLYISSIGYKDKKMSSQPIPTSITLIPDVSQLDEVIVTTRKEGKYKTQKVPPYVHDNYFRCWLPTVDSEVAVLMTKPTPQSTRLASLLIPIKHEASKSNPKKNAAFSSLFKVQFYANTDGQPGDRLPYQDIIFRITEKDKPPYTLNIEKHQVFVPDEGLFVAIQVLGYTDTEGKLQNAKRYHEVKTKKGIVKISTTYRPLLPFTDKINPNRTFTRRIFFKNRTWQKFDSTYSTNNNLIRTQHTNYGLGGILHVFRE